MTEEFMDDDNAQKSVILGLEYIADSPPEEHGGFHPTTVQIAKDALKAIRGLREAVLMYHEAWNGCEGDWHAAMKFASMNAEAVLWKKKRHLCKQIAEDYAQEPDACISDGNPQDYGD